jgi:hypothetical protein
MVLETSLREAIPVGPRRACCPASVAVHYRIERAGKILRVDDHDPARKPLLDGQVVVSFDPTRIRLWPASPEMLGVLEEAS